MLATRYHIYTVILVMANALYVSIPSLSRFRKKYTS